jgi:hypothetical protein
MATERRRAAAGECAEHERLGCREQVAVGGEKCAAIEPNHLGDFV